MESQQQIATTDNNGGSCRIDEQQCRILQPFSGVPIEDLRLEDHPNLLIFPSKQERKDGIEKETIYNIIDNGCLATHNIMGYIGMGNTLLRIYSRFTKQDNPDYFFHYMLQKVFGINLFDLKYNTANDEISYLLLYLFPAYLKNALHQGLYKEYHRFNHNDAHVRGQIDISRHINKNIPYTGNVAYRTRDYSYNNAITQLLRHTIEHIRLHPDAPHILSNDDDTKSLVQIIKQATPNYNRQQRQAIIHQNLRMVRHPYYSEYYELQRLCLRILRNEKISYGNNNDEVYGILFDGAWLWEEYLSTILSDFHHPKNKKQTGAIPLFKNNTAKRYPDFYNDDFVLDAKYKRLEGKRVSEVDRDDLHQIITYMYITKVKIGGFVFPVGGDIEDNIPEGKLCGYGGEVRLYGMQIPQDTSSWHEFQECMQKQERKLQQKIL